MCPLCDHLYSDNQTYTLQALLLLNCTLLTLPLPKTVSICESEVKASFPLILQVGQEKQVFSSTLGQSHKEGVHLESESTSNVYPHKY